MDLTNDTDGCIKNALTNEVYCCQVTNLAVILC